MALDGLIQQLKRFTAATVASLALSCNCGNESLSPLEYCAIPENHRVLEICNNDFDENCNGILDDGCDNDNDNYCSKDHVLFYTNSPRVCSKTFEPFFSQTYPEMEYNCLPGGGYNPSCQQLKIDCHDENPNVHPDALEICDGLDNNCNYKIDESFPEFHRECNPPGDTIVIGGSSICRSGTYTACTGGKKICTGYIGPEEESCPLLDENCDGRVNEDGALTGARKCYTDQQGNSLPLNHDSIFPTQKGNCLLGIELCINGVIGGDGICYGAILPKQEVCDCQDNDCNDNVDDSSSLIPLEIVFGLDISSSMKDEDTFQKIRQHYTAVQALFCAEAKARISTVVIGKPVDQLLSRGYPALEHNLISIQEFRNFFAEDFPAANGPSGEPTLNTILYAACASLETDGQYNRLCETIRPENTLIRPSTPVFTAGSLKQLIIETDEPAQWIKTSSLTFNQQQIAEVVQQSRLQLLIYTKPIYNTLETNDNGNVPLQGYGYFVQHGAILKDIHNSNFRQDLEDLLNNKYCQGLTMTSTRSD